MRSMGQVMEQCLASDKEMTEKSRGDTDLSNILLGQLILNIENKLSLQHAGLGDDYLKPYEVS